MHLSQSLLFLIFSLHIFWCLSPAVENPFLKFFPSRKVAFASETNYKLIYSFSHFVRLSYFFPVTQNLSTQRRVTLALLPHLIPPRYSTNNHKPSRSYLLHSFIFASMTKKSSKKTLSQLHESDIGEERQNPSSAPKKSASEIDEIFAGKKRKKSAVEKSEKPDEVTKRIDRKKKNDKKKGDGEFVARPSRPRKRTEDGLTLYTEEELGLNKGDAGGTPLHLIALVAFDGDCQQ